MLFLAGKGGLGGGGILGVSLDTAFGGLDGFFRCIDAEQGVFELMVKFRQARFPFGFTFIEGFQGMFGGFLPLSRMFLGLDDFRLTFVDAPNQLVLILFFKVYSVEVFTGFDEPFLHGVHFVEFSGQKCFDFIDSAHYLAVPGAHFIQAKGLFFSG